MNVIPTRLPGVLILEPKVYRDPRGHFFETWHRDRYAEAGLPSGFVQDNLSFSGGGVLRGLHLQNPSPQAKLISVPEGAVFDVAVDVRVGSPTFGQWAGEFLSGENRRQFFVPAGFAHGFVVTGDHALVTYKCDAFYAPGGEMTVLWNDPDLAIAWPATDPILSTKDREGLRLRDVPTNRLPRFEG